MLSYPLITLAAVMMLVFTISHADAAILVDEKSSAIESSASDENDALFRDKKDTSFPKGQHVIPSPLRRHHLKFGVLGKRNDAEELNNELEEWLNNLRERRAGRPHYGLLG